MTTPDSTGRRSLLGRPTSVVAAAVGSSPDPGQSVAVTRSASQVPVLPSGDDPAAPVALFRDHGKHRPASHPVLRRAYVRHGIESRWALGKIEELEQIVTDLLGVELDEGLMDRYERALTRGHADNLRRARELDE